MKKKGKFILLWFHGEGSLPGATAIDCFITFITSVAVATGSTRS